MKNRLLTTWWGMLISSVILLGVAYCWMLLATETGNLFEYALLIAFLIAGINRLRAAIKILFHK